MEVLELKNKVEIPLIGLGTYKLKGQACIDSVRNALELGYRHIDTADYYGNHKEIGFAIKDTERRELFITSKVWNTDLKYDDVLRTFERFAEELDTTYLDLLLIHWPNEKIPIKDTLKAFKKLYDQKKIRAAGVSNFSIRQLKSALEAADIPICMNQVEFHVFLYQKELLEFCNAQNVRITAYCPVARGLVNENSVIINIAEKHKKSPSQVALRWLVQKEIVAIPKASSIGHLRENISIFDFELSGKELLEIDSIREKHRVVNF